MMRYSIDVTDDLRETKVHGAPSFPFETHVCRFALSSNGIISWHWHPEIEIIKITRGQIICSAGTERLPLSVGDCVLINSNVLHMYVPQPGSDDPEHKTIMFHPSLLADSASDIYSNYVDPIVSCRALPFIYLSGGAEWQKQACDLLEEIRHLDPESCFGYELRCRILLSSMWLLIADHMRGVYLGSDVTESQLINEQRAKRMLAFIHRHFNEDLTVDSIAASASISRSECFRCFKRALNKKPIEYLTEYRVEQATRLLIESDLSVTDICYRCGFGSPSYFGKVFRSVMGFSPRDYRHALSADDSASDEDDQ